MNYFLTFFVFVTFMAPTQVGFAQDSKGTTSWNQWGGIGRNFSLPDADQVEYRKPPKPIWTRKIGPGHSAIVTDGEFGYCQFLDNEQEALRKFELDSGKTVWQIKYPTRYRTSNSQYVGPHATPAVAGNSIIVASVDAQILAFELSTGKLNWKRSLPDSFQTKLPQSGYASSPLIYREMVMVPGLGASQKKETETYIPNLPEKSPPGMVALDLETGKTVWKSESFRSSHGSPILVELEGQPMLVLHGMFHLIGINPADGKQIWKHLLRRQAADNVSFTPIWDQDRQQFLVTHGYCDRGTQAVGIKLVESKWQTQLNWQNRNLRIVHTNGIMLGRYLVGTNREPSTLMVGVEIDSGETKFRQRGFGKSNLVGSKEFAMVLDEQGQLRGMRVSESGLKDAWRLNALDSTAWTAPTVAGRQLLVRDATELKMFRFE